MCQRGQGGGRVGREPVDAGVPVPGGPAVAGVLERLVQVRVESVACAAVVDAGGRQLTAMAFQAEQYRQLRARGKPVSGPARITALGGAVQVHPDADAFAASSPASSAPQPTRTGFSPTPNA